MQSKMCKYVKRILTVVPFLTLFLSNKAQALEFQTAITGDITPKSIVYSGKGFFFAQNMMYRHTITVYDRSYRLIKTIPDSVRLSDFGYTTYRGIYQGSPVEAAFTPNGKYAWISNYQMYGKGFTKPGNDGAFTGYFDKSFVYKINTETFAIEKIIKVGSVPKFLAIDPFDKFLLVSNWSSRSITLINLKTEKVIRKIIVGNFPRGIIISPDGRYAYIAVMGSNDIAILDLANYSLDWIKEVGRAPRHVIISPDGKTLYASINGEGTVAKIDLTTKTVLSKLVTGDRPRSMVMTPDGKYLYVVNYKSNTVSKVRTDNFTVIDTVNTDTHPIGITYDPETKNVWVACYRGVIMVFHDDK